jgi:hypothetical protein
VKDGVTPDQVRSSIRLSLGYAYAVHSAPIKSFDDLPRLAFIATPLHVPVPLPVELIPHHSLRRASEQEAASIRETLDAKDMVGSLVYEAVAKSEGRSQRSADPRDWRYFVVEVSPEYKGAVNAGIGDIERAAQLTDAAIECGFMFNTEGVRIVVNQPGVNVLDASTMLGLYGKYVELTEEAIAEFRDVYTRIEDIAPQIPDIDRAIDSLNRLRAVARGTPLRILGLFAIMESLITHDPHDMYDSLGHQIRTKMQLLGRRFRKPLRYDVFSGATAEKVWKKLYACRSCIAHGGQLAFDGDLKILGKLEVVEEFVLSATRRVLQQALIEPELVLDLRAC